MSTVPQNATSPSNLATIPAVTSASTYDDVPYGSYPVPSSHPDRMYNMAKLFGLEPVLPDQARILEIGCAGGGNLLPLASLFPNAECVGVELSQVQCDYGIEAIKYTQFQNASIHQGSVTDITPEFGKFDYIICHGVFSWVPEFVREAILRVSSQNLSERGVAYISYNVLPGWYMRGMIRGMMIEHVKNIPEPRKKIDQARALLKFLVESNAKSNTAHAIYLRTEADLLAKMPDSYILHEHLEDTNQAYYFRDFITAASKFGLQFLGEASISSTWAGNLSPEAQKGLEPIQDAVARGHYMDCIVGRTFRETYLVPAASKVNRSLEDARLREMRFIGQFESQKPESGSPAGNKCYKLKTGHVINTADVPTQEILESLSQIFPESLSLEQILEILEKKKLVNNDHAQLASKMMSTLVHGVLGGWADFRFLPDRLKVRDWTRPKVTSWARAQAQANHFVTNLRHEFLRVDTAQRQIIQMLDGTRDVNDIASELKVLIDTGLLDVKVTGTYHPSQLPKLVAQQSLQSLAEKSLFLADS